MSTWAPSDRAQHEQDGVELLQREAESDISGQRAKRATRAVDPAGWRPMMPHAPWRMPWVGRLVLAHTNTLQTLALVSFITSSQRVHVH